MHKTAVIVVVSFAKCKLVYWTSLRCALAVIVTRKLSALRSLSNANVLANTDWFKWFFFSYFLLADNVSIWLSPAVYWSTNNNQLFLASKEIVSRNFMCNIMCCNDAAIAVHKSQV